jgi:hypothetical protein
MLSIFSTFSAPLEFVSVPVMCTLNSSYLSHLEGVIVPQTNLIDSVSTASCPIALEEDVRFEV